MFHFDQIQSVIQQPSQPSVIQSTALQTTALQTVQLSKGNVILLKQPSNSVIQSPGGGNLQTVQVRELGGIGVSCTSINSINLSLLVYKYKK